ncbi:MAG: calcium/sodium antiporter [Alphaproteobacteria bacterium]|nr:calcium/sodium antiporter [Alphaproteobacteria bacterium]
MEIALLIIGGLLLLAIGGEFLVRGAVQLAERMGVSPLIIGITLVGFGTSTPELVTSIQAAIAGLPGIAVGNIVGSNVANVLLILGASAVVAPVMVSSKVLARDGVLVLSSAVAFTLIGWFWMLDRVVGAIFIAGLVAYLIYAWRQERTGGDDHTAAYDKAEAIEAAHDPPSLHLKDGRTVGRTLLSLGYALGGLAMVVIGGRILIEGSVELARDFGISETVIGLTIVAIGTSMPELVTSILAAIRRQADVALGNILGSNIYNTLGIGGATALAHPTTMPQEVNRFDNPVMVGMSVLLLVFAATGLRISRREGAVMLACYVAYIYSLWPS